MHHGVGERLHAVIAELLLLPRSLTGRGVTETLAGLPGDIEVHAFATGEPALDWVVPQEWVLRTARLTAPDGTVIADAAVHPLHVLGYSTAVDVRLPLADLQPHLHSDPAAPSAIPFRTAYYSPAWGFCLPHAVREALPDGEYHALVDADHVDGRMPYGQRVLPGSSDAEVLITSHTCHPGMANDNLSGNVVAAALAERVAALPDRRLTWRFLWLPGTIGELAWLAANPEVRARAVGGLVLAGVGDRGDLRYKRSRRGDGVVDRAVAAVLAERAPDASAIDPYSPWGYAERQFNSLGIDLPVGRLSRTPFGAYPEYHTSADDLSFVTAAQLGEALEVATAVVEAVDAARTWRNLRPEGEPRLGARGLYPSTGGQRAREQQLALLWVLAESDGATDLLAIAERSGLPVGLLDQAARRLAATDLLAEEAR